MLYIYICVVLFLLYFADVHKVLAKSAAAAAALGEAPPARVQIRCRCRDIVYGWLNKLGGPLKRVRSSFTGICGLCKAGLELILIRTMWLFLQIGDPFCGGCPYNKIPTTWALY